MLSLYCGKATQAWWESQLVGTVSGLVLGIVGTCLTQYLAHRYTTKLEANRARLLFVNSYFIKDILGFIDKEVYNFQQIHAKYYELKEGEELEDDLSHRQQAAAVLSSIAMFRDKKLSDNFNALLEQRNKVMTSHIVNVHLKGADKLGPAQLMATVEEGIQLAASLKIRISELCSLESK
ncbi:hypothetical protein KGP26_15395 [Serratia sp. JSRIV002]|uniref:hypothetical protein n=1 Tax=Serratia sp. JSRIV002 TaxID=2831894 RepID=UPI001CBADC72|nr:hypothetical protein [Serratia sp. JSRIV002]UAN49185.1 hypothetical protein KGP26_15395 [Serratia sp. JSRIV002]